MTVYRIPRIDDPTPPVPDMAFTAAAMALDPAAADVGGGRLVINLTPAIAAGKATRAAAPYILADAFGRLAADPGVARLPRRLTAAAAALLVYLAAIAGQLVTGWGWLVPVAGVVLLTVAAILAAILADAYRLARLIHALSAIRPSHAGPSRPRR